MNKITKWFKTHKPMDFKYIIIMFLVFYILKQKAVWYMTALIGFVTYPEVIDKTVFTDIGIIFKDAFTKVYDIGFNLAETFHPYNLLIGKCIVWGIIIWLVVFILFVIIYLINSMCYKEAKK